MEILSTEAYGPGDSQIELTLLESPVEHGLAGMLRSASLKNDVAIVVDPHEGEDYDFACFGCGENGVAPRIILQPDLFADLKSGTDEALTILFHELGHYHNGDCENEEYIRDYYMTDRMNRAESGQILPMEVDADAFAVQYIGRDRAKNGLLQLKKRLEKTEDSELALSEVVARIAAMGV